jgi:RNA polymerase sigma factor for flagellar operon FliA
MTVAEPAISWLMRQDEITVDVKSEAFMENLVEQAKESVRYLANKLASRLPAHVDVEDLYQMGMIGLLQSVDRFDASRGIKFQTYANRRVQGAMLDYLRSLDWRPRSVRRRNREIAEAVSTVEQRLGGTADSEEIISEMGISAEEYNTWLAEGSMPRAGEFVHADANSSAAAEDFMSTIPDTAATPEESVVSEQMQEVLAQAIEHLPENERIVMQLYYYEQVPMRDIGKQLGVKQARVSQLHSQALRRLRLRVKNNRPFGHTLPQTAVAVAPRKPAARVISITSRKRKPAPVETHFAPAA